jgi:hypothetical protein
MAKARTSEAISDKFNAESVLNVFFTEMNEIIFIIARHLLTVRLRSKKVLARDSLLIAVFCVVTPCSLVDRYQLFYIGSRLLRNTDSYLKNYMVS